MRVLILAAGLGTRLLPLTETVPKCLMTIGGKPLLQILLETLTNAGLGPFLINTHHLHQEVEKFLWTSEFADRVTMVYEPVLLGTGRTFLNNLDFFGGQECMVLHADNFTLDDFTEFLAFHRCRPHGCEITLMSFRTDRPRECGIIEVDEKNEVTSFHEKVERPPGNLANGAIYIFSGNFLRQVEQFNNPTINDLTGDIVANLPARTISYETKEVFLDIGVKENLELAREYMRRISRS